MSFYIISYHAMPCRQHNNYSNDITKVSIFNCTVPEEMNQLFNVIGTLLSQTDPTARHFWKTCKFHDTIETCFVSIWLVRRMDEEASCFQMIMVPLAECDGVWSKCMHACIVYVYMLFYIFLVVGSSSE